MILTFYLQIEGFYLYQFMVKNYIIIILSVMDKIFAPMKYKEIDKLTIEFALSLWKDGEEPAATQEIVFTEIPGSQSQSQSDEAAKKDESDENDEYFDYVIKQKKHDCKKSWTCKKGGRIVYLPPSSLLSV